MQYSSQVYDLMRDRSRLLRDPLILPQMSVGVAGDTGKGCWVGFAMQRNKGFIEAIFFQAFGCPHLLAACAFVAEHFEGRPVGDIDALDTADLMRSLQIPTEKAGKMLILQDALVACLNSSS
ncbi:MAG: iron-sulfur cluster assembly scaffold protein [Gammaproteobacteria bacterium]|nr:iron-sulfur cluster assembly scaffold protein [Gammaproteobacteria bacterium]